MPELPEVEITVRGLVPVLEGQQVARLVLTRPDLRRPFPDDLVQRMTGAKITALSRRGKYGLFATDRGDTMIWHLGMSGCWRSDAAEMQKHDHLRLQTGAGLWLALNDPRRFGLVDLVSGEPAQDFAPFVTMGPEPLSDDFDTAALARALAGRTAPVKQMLLDQRVVAGLGNIYVCEALFMSGIAPTSPAGSISRARLSRLVDASKSVLVAAIAAGGSSLRDFVHPDGQLGYFSHAWRVYGRAGEACHACGTTVERLVQGGRSTFFCRRCQH